MAPDPPLATLEPVEQIALERYRRKALVDDPDCYRGIVKQTSGFLGVSNPTSNTSTTTRCLTCSTATAPG